jgi:hypothetical protein
MTGNSCLFCCLRNTKELQRSMGENASFLGYFFTQIPHNNALTPRDESVCHFCMKKFVTWSHVMYVKRFWPTCMKVSQCIQHKLQTACGLPAWRSVSASNMNHKQLGVRETCVTRGVFMYCISSPDHSYVLMYLSNVFGMWYSNKYKRKEFHVV